MCKKKIRNVAIKVFLLSGILSCACYFLIFSETVNAAPQVSSQENIPHNYGICRLCKNCPPPPVCLPPLPPPEIKCPPAPPPPVCEECPQLCELVDCNGDPITHPDARRYDLNGDCRITEDDGHYIVNYILEMNADPDSVEFNPWLDINGDGRINPFDVLLFTSFYHELGIECGEDPAPTPTPTPTPPLPTPTPTPECEFVDCNGNPITHPDAWKFDLNGDCRITEDDGNYIVNYIRERNADPDSVEYDERLDFNGDEMITPFDALIVANFIYELGAECGEDPAPTPTPTPPLPTPTPPLPTPTPTPEPELECVYNFNATTIDRSKHGAKAFLGEYDKVPCLDQIVRNVTGGRANAHTLRAYYAMGGRSTQSPTWDDFVFIELKKLMGIVECNGLERIVGNCVPSPGAQYLDRECRPVNEVSNLQEICGSIDFRYIPSPISFIWSEDLSIESRGVVSRFSINPDEPGWYIWRGSKETPLLVFDPEKTGMIHDGSQLFGNYTFGGKDAVGKKNISLRSGEYRSETWADGFEAMSMLDRNGDGVLSGTELDGLGIWFDYNQNGVSDPGEVISLAEAGVTELRYQGAYTDPLGNIRLAAGFTVEKDGVARRGELVDWHSRKFDSKEEALLALTSRSTIASLMEEGKESRISSEEGIGLPQVSSDVSEHAAVSKSSGMSLWHWELAEGQSEDLASTSGYFYLEQDENGKVYGYSLIELGIEDPKKKVSSTIISLPLEGELDSGKTFSFSVTHPGSGIRTHSKAEVKGSQMNGSSTLTDTSGTTLEYRWNAVKVGEKKAQ
jgi:hypothetical protein